MSSAVTVTRSDRELVEALRAFPDDVLPVMRDFFMDESDVMKTIEASVMFDRTALHPPRAPWPVAEPRIQPSEESQLDRSATTVRKTTSAPCRNDPCPCGSGKKFKKCCVRR